MIWTTKVGIIPDGPLGTRSESERNLESYASKPRSRIRRCSGGDHDRDDSSNQPGSKRPRHSGKDNTQYQPHPSIILVTQRTGSDENAATGDPGNPITFVRPPTRVELSVLEGTLEDGSDDGESSDHRNAAAEHRGVAELSSQLGLRFHDLSPEEFYKVCEDEDQRRRIYDYLVRMSM